MTTSARSPSADSDATIAAGSKSFALASRLFDADTRAQVRDLYAWCRHCDDTIDGQTLGHGADPTVDREARLATLVDASERAMTGEAPAPAGPFAALQRVVRASSLPAELPRDHLRGFAMDAGDRRYESVHDTLDYCYHVAGVVGLMMAWIMGVRDIATLERACDLGIAFQLTNIARDIGEDLACGRIYLPATWLLEYGASLVPGALLDPRTAASIVPAVDRLLRLADRYYASAWHGVGRLPLRSAWAVATALDVYRDIGVEVSRRGADAWTGRVSLGTGHKLNRVARALPESMWAIVRGRAVSPPPRGGLWTPRLGSMLR